MESITQYWPQFQLRPILTWEQKEELDMLEAAIEADAVPTAQLDPHLFIPTQDWIDLEILHDLIDVEYTPAVLLIQAEYQFFIHDGHHRATRALLDGQTVKSVVYNLNNRG